MTFICLDIGEKRIGVALSDPTATLASPWGVLPGNESLDRLGQRLHELMDERAAGALVVGLPRHMNGDLGPEADRARLIADAMAARLGIPAHLWDERLTTVEATRRLIEAGMSRKKRKQSVDKLAATLILQSFLDARAVAELPG